MRRSDGRELRADFHSPGDDEDGRTLAVVVTDEGVLFDAFAGGEHAGTKAMMADEWFEEVAGQQVEDYWADHPQLDDWHYEVANGDTREGFWAWLAASGD